MKKWRFDKNQSIGLVWYIGHGPTHQRRVSMRRGLAIVCGIVSAAVFTLIVNAILTYGFVHWGRTHSALVKLRTQVLDEVLTEAALLRIYPPSSARPLAPPATLVKALPPIAETSAETKAETRAVEKRVDIRKLAFERNGNSLQVQFELHNVLANSTQHGKLWGVVLVHHSDGGNELVSFPAKLSFDPHTLRPVTLDGAHHFAVKRFSQMSFTAKSRSEKATFLVIKVGAHSKEGEVWLEKSIIIPPSTT